MLDFIIMYKRKLENLGSETEFKKKINGELDLEIQD